MLKSYRLIQELGGTVCKESGLKCQERLFGEGGRIDVWLYSRVVKLDRRIFIQGVL